MAGALRDVRVLEFGHYIAGPLLGILLADHGADVLKVEPPGGEPGRASDAFEAWNRGKRSVVIDLKTAWGRERAEQLARHADVVIENFRPGVAERLGVGAQRLLDVNPGLIYCALPGFGAESPYRDVRAWEGIVGARTATYRPTAASSQPVYTALPISSTYAGMLGAATAVAALIARQRDGGAGQAVEVPLHAATFVAMGYQLLRQPGSEPPPAIRPASPLVNIYRCGDGRYLQFHAATERFVRDFFATIDEPELGALALQLRAAPDAALARDLFTRMDALFLTRSAAEWEQVTIQAQMPGSVSRTVEEFLAHPHAAASGAIVEVESPALGRTRQAGIHARLHATPGAIRGGAPLLGDAGQDGWLEERGEASQPAPAELHGAGAPPLQGIRVLDLCIILAGPTCGRTLAELGADVIKIDDPRRASGPGFHLDVDRGKRSILLDLKNEAGREVFWRLAEQADVVTQNYRQGALDRLGLGYAEVARRRPHIIYASLNAFGQEGPWAPRPGWEQLAQALSGTQVRYGGRDAAPLLQPYAVNDYGTGIMGAFAVLLALRERARTGIGQHVDTALLYTACTMQAPFMLDYAGRQRHEVEGQAARGPSARSRLYQAADGWLYLHLDGDAELARLRALAPFESLPDGADDAALAAALMGVFGSRPVAEWLSLLHGAGLTAVKNAPFNEFFDDPTLRAAGLVVTREHPGIGDVTHLGAAPRLARTPAQPGRPAEPFGCSTDAVLAEHGLTPQEIAALRASGAVA